MVRDEGDGSPPSGAQTPALDRARDRREFAIVATAGLVQGLAFVTVPAASTVFQSADSYRLSSSEYGSLFVPLVVLSIVGSSIGVAMARRWGARRVFLAGLCVNGTAAAIITLSQLFAGRHGPALAILLTGMAFLGLAMGLTLTALNTRMLHPAHGVSGAAVTALHAIVSLGNALAPLLAVLFLGVARWWFLPLTVGICFFALLLIEFRQPSWSMYAHGAERAAALALNPTVIRAGFLGFAFLALLYGVCEAVFASWATTFLHQDKGLSQSFADVSLSAFWAMLVLGRIAAVAICARFSARWTYLALPVLIVAAFVTIPNIDGAAANIIAFGFAGLACSAFFPLTLNFSNQRFPDMADLTSGGLTAAVMAGIGIGSFGVGPLRSVFSLSDIYTGASALAVLMGILALFLTGQASAGSSIAQT